MRIALVAPAIWSSVHWDFALALQRLGHRVVVYTEDRSAASGWRFDRHAREGIECFVISDSRRNPWTWPLDRLAKPLLGRRFFTTLSAVRRFLQATRECDLVLCEGDWMGVFVALAGERSLNWMVSVHDTLYLRIPITYPGRPASRWREALKLWVLRTASRVRANSYVTRDALVQGGCSAARIVVLPLPIAGWMRLPQGTDLEAFREAARRDIRALWNIFEGAPLYIVMCRLDPAKGLELAVQALACHRDPGARVLVCGGDRQVGGLGSYSSHLQGLARQHGVRERLIFAGHVNRDEVKRYLAAADVHVAPSVIDTFNYAVVEAALVGTPSLMSDHVGAAPWIVQAGAGEIVAGRDPSTWAERMVDLAARRRDASARRSMSAAIQSSLDPDTIARALVNEVTIPP